MSNRLAFFTFIIATLLAGCASTPTRINGLNLENSGLISDIELNGVLISHGDKFVLDKAFHIPTVPSIDYPSAPWDFSVSFTDIPTGPWKFNGSTLFPEFDSSSITCEEGDQNTPGDCGRYKQLSGPFINIECESRFFVPNSSITYSERRNEIERKKTKEREKTEVEYDYTYEYNYIYKDREGNILDREKIEAEHDNTIGKTVTDTVVGVGLVGVIAGIVVVMGASQVAFAPLEIGMNTLGVCTEHERRIWFDHDEFFDTVKNTVLNDYGSVNAYVTDIRQASMAYKTLANIDNIKRGEIEPLIREWNASLNKLLPDTDRMDNYRIRYSPYAPVKIPRKEDWSRKRAVIESDILNHYAKQHTSINRQMDSYNKLLKQRHGMNINLSTEVKLH